VIQPAPEAKPAPKKRAPVRRAPVATKTDCVVIIRGGAKITECF